MADENEILIGFIAILIIYPLITLTIGIKNYIKGRDKSLDGLQDALYRDDPDWVSIPNILITLIVTIALGIGVIYMLGWCIKLFIN